MLWGNTTWKKVIRGWKLSWLLPPTLACFHLSVFISQACRQSGVCAANNAVLQGMLCPQSATPGWHCPLSVLWATVVASPAPCCHINQVSLAHICWIIASPCVPGWSRICVANCLTLATSAAVAPSTLSHSLLQSFSSLQPRAILRKQMQA